MKGEKTKDPNLQLAFEMNNLNGFRNFCSISPRDAKLSSREQEA